MGVLSQYRTERHIERLLREDDLSSQGARDAISRLHGLAADAVPALVERLRQASQEDLRRIAGILYRLLQNDTLEHFTAALKTESGRPLKTLVKLLGHSTRYDPNRLIELLDDPDIPTSVLIEILSVHHRRLNAERLLRYAARVSAADHIALFKIIGSIADESLVSRLLNRLTAADPSIRANVVRLLASFPSDRVVEAVVERLGDDSKTVRLAAIESLKEMDASPGIEQLVGLLRDPDLVIQSHGIDAIVRVHDPRTIEYLLPVLQDESEYIRRAAVEVINAIADTSLVGDLLAILRDQDWWVRERAADALARIGGPRVVEAMLELIRSDDEFIRRTAIEVINTSRDPRCYEYLLQALDDADWWVRERAIDALAAIGRSDAVPTLVQALATDDQARATILRALATLGDRQAVPAILECLDADEIVVRIEALRALEALVEESDADQACARIEQAAERGNADFRERARNTLHEIRARLSATSSDDGSGSIQSTMIAPPGEPPRRLATGTLLDIATLQPGTVLDHRYRYIEQIGRGAFGTVLRFEDTTVNEEITLKFLNTQVAADDRAFRRFVQELRYARRVTHPNVIRIYDFLRLGGLYAISMEYFDGYPLTREVDGGRPMRLDRALRVLREVTFGMASAHKSGVIHRDLKPANILMNSAGEVKVVDFGIAAAAAGTEDPELTATGAFIGTPAYTSPEQICGGTLDARSDIYALGVVMYRMLSGRLPYQEKERRTMLNRHLEGRAPALAELNPDLPAALADLVARAMAVKPAQRHQSMIELRRDLERFMQ